jgi:glutathione S-transferase
MSEERTVMASDVLAYLLEKHPGIDFGPKNPEELADYLEWAKKNGCNCGQYPHVETCPYLGGPQ